MQDFRTSDEAAQFSLLGPLRSASEYPYTHIDSYLHGCDLAECDVRAADYAKLMERFSNAFRPDVVARQKKNNEFKLYF